MVKITFRDTCQTALSISAFTVIGHLCSRVVTRLTTPEVYHLTACCALFMTIDTLAKKFFRTLLNKLCSNDFVKAGIRMGTSAGVSILVFNQVAALVELPKVEFKLAATVIGISAVVYHLLVWGYKKINEPKDIDMNEVLDNVANQVEADAKRLFNTHFKGKTNNKIFDDVSKQMRADAKRLLAANQ